MRLQHFDSIEDVLAFIRSAVPENPFRSSGGKYIWAKDGDGGRLVPPLSSPFSSPYLYRGQAERHRPCLPTVFRGLKRLVRNPQKLSRRDRAKLFLARIRLEEFLLALADHPAYVFSEEIKLLVSPEAVAQHYELATDRLDLTQDPEVAAFFATNSRSENGHWSAIPSGEGVVYRLDATYMRRLLGPERESQLECVGRQVWPRPGEQRAWVLQLPLGLDLEALPIDVFTFNQQEQAGQRFNEKFEEGKLLFPPDILSDVAREISTCASISSSLVAKILTAYGCTGDMHRRELEASVPFFARHFGIAVTDRKPISFSALQLATAETQLAQLKQTFFDGVRVQAVRRLTPAEIEAYRRD
jgi:hypothetical protein